jgi:hypothetical protein
VPAPAAAAPSAAAPAPVLTRADSVAIARAVAREFERAMAAAPAVPAKTRAAGRTDSAREHRTATEVVADSLVRVGTWQHVPREVVRAVVGRMPMEEWAAAAASPEDRRHVDEALREVRRQFKLKTPEGRDGLPGGVTVGPPPAPPIPPPGLVIRTPWPGFTAITAKMPAPVPGARRAALVGTTDETGRSDLSRLGPVLDAALRARLRATAGYEVTGPEVAAVARAERVPDAVVLKLTGAEAVLRAKLRTTDDGAVRATLHVRGGRGAPPAAVEARVSLADVSSLGALADSLAAPLARGAAAALAARDARAGAP